VVASLGYRVERGIGDAGFRIDLGVLHPDPGRGYILGIECDGGTWMRDRSARVREVWRPRVLQQRGWKLHRVWSSRWWEDHSGESQKLKDALASAVSSREGKGRS
jgi:hypothetical protein